MFLGNWQNGLWTEVVRCMFLRMHQSAEALLKDLASSSSLALGNKSCIYAWMHALWFASVWKLHSTNMKHIFLMLFSYTLGWWYNKKSKTHLRIELARCPPLRPLSLAARPHVGMGTCYSTLVVLCWNDTLGSDLWGIVLWTDRTRYIAILVLLVNLRLNVLHHRLNKAYIFFCFKSW